MWIVSLATHLPYTYVGLLCFSILMSYLLAVVLSIPTSKSLLTFRNYLYGSQIKGGGGGREVNTCSCYTVPYVVVNWVYEFPYVGFLISAPYITLTWMAKLPETVGYIFSSSCIGCLVLAVQLATKGKDDISRYFFEHSRLLGSWVALWVNLGILKTVLSWLSLHFIAGVNFCHSCFSDFWVRKLKTKLIK